MNRRNFIKSSTVSGLALYSQPFSLALNAPKYKLGYQLFSIRDFMDIDAVDTLKKLKSVGYEDFEIYGYDASENSIYGYTPKAFMNILKDLDLSVSSGHYGFSDYLTKTDDELKKYVDQCIVAAKELDSQYITWPWLDPSLRNMDTYKMMPGKLNLIGEQVSKAGLGFAYHNHGFEFDKHDGACGYDIIVKETDPELVKLQLDMYWVMHSSDKTPKEIVKEHPGRIVMWHIKDMDKQTRDYSELGNGSIDYTKELPDPALSGLEYYYIEQGGNYAHNSMQSAIDSAKYFKENLSHKL